MIAVAPDKTGTRTLLRAVRALHALPDRRTRPQTTRARGKARLIDVDQSLLFLFGLITAFEKVLASHAMLRFEGLSVQQRFFYD